MASAWSKVCLDVPFPTYHSMAYYTNICTSMYPIHTLDTIWDGFCLISVSFKQYYSTPGHIRYSTTSQGGRSWRASSDHQISLTALARSACLQIFATKTLYFHNCKSLQHKRSGSCASGDRRSRGRATSATLQPVQVKGLWKDRILEWARIASVCSFHNVVSSSITNPCFLLYLHINILYALLLSFTTNVLSH